MINGSIVALITPMLSDGSVDYASLERLVAFHIEQGTDAIVAVGTTGESSTLPADEHVAVVAQTVRFVAGRIPVIAGNGGNATAEAIALTKALADTGVDAMLGVTPYYNKPTQHGLVVHFKAVAAVTDIPQILYNVPGRTGVDLVAETAAELAQVNNIIGIKDATGQLARLPVLRRLCGDDFILLSGDDATACEFMLGGGNGVISVTNNVAAKQFKAMCDAALANNATLARQLDEPMHALYTQLFCEANPIPVKWAVARMGLIADGHLRLPLTPLSDNFHDDVVTAMIKARIEVL
ncbi:4-hydroxy-tetrahydrodipicolinate synthase [Shewanella sp. NIFS-20-20]|uniref:4-hydroxy-tetrahydrodipicolinate synthase n=1 Tax=Shewanella sp. NIFS-20-20 TaxID=2853806 RepID=UPI001C453633|nr:4-hydroxy-tetrahydrodipicolinate synthase [Shewanella sp. NIFS-20-20]MBV7317020.1 4-hydroxy-tetrahydrodipicolinate synthase [Shewanella sp. NIFS-20-20]